MYIAVYFVLLYVRISDRWFQGSVEGVRDLLRANILVKSLICLVSCRELTSVYYEASFMKSWVRPV